MSYVLNSAHTRLLHDIADSKDLPADVLAKSGDCFITLATTLDEVLHMEAVGAPARPQLEQTVKHLTYLQRHYQVVKRDTPDYRQ